MDCRFTHLVTEEEAYQALKTYYFFLFDTDIVRNAAAALIAVGIAWLQWHRGHGFSAGVASVLAVYMLLGCCWFPVFWRRVRRRWRLNRLFELVGEYHLTDEFMEFRRDGNRARYDYQTLTSFFVVRDRVFILQDRLFLACFSRGSLRGEFDEFCRLLEAAGLENRSSASWKRWIFPAILAGFTLLLWSYVILGCSGETLSKSVF